MAGNPLFSAKGRVNRAPFIAQYIFTCGLLLGAQYLIEFLGAGFGSVSFMLLVMVPVLAIVVAAGISMICTSIKRLHDLNHSGLMYLLVLVPIINLFFLLYLAIRPTRFPQNQYGIDPLTPSTPCPNCGKSGTRPPGKYICSKCEHRFEIRPTFEVNSFDPLDGPNHSMHSDAAATRHRR